MSKISVITPVLPNDNVFLYECGQPLKNQLYKDFEWILVTPHDNAEIDAAVSTFQRDIHIQIVRTSDDSGVGFARNRGIQKAAGKWVYFLDVDDFLDVHTLFCLHETAQHSHADLVIGKLQTMYGRPGESIAYRCLLERMILDRHVTPKPASAKQRRMTPLNILFRKQLLLDNDIRFDETLDGICGLSFMCGVFDRTDRVFYDSDAFYGRRYRDDRIRFPNVRHRNKDVLPKQRAIACQRLMETLDPDGLAKNALDTFAINTWYRTASRSVLTHSENRSIRKQTLRLWQHVLSRTNPANSATRRRIKDGYKRTEIALYRKGFVWLGSVLSKMRLWFHSNWKLLVSPRRRAKWVYQHVFTRLRIKRHLVVYECYLGRNMSDSPRAICEYLETHYPGKFKHVWVFDNPRQEMPRFIRQVKRFSATHLYYAARCAFLIFNMRQPGWFQKKSGQTFVATWHGTPLKKLMFDMDAVYSAKKKNYKMNVYEQSRYWDYLLSANPYSTTAFRSAFLFDNDMLELGYPRNDLLHSPDRDAVAAEVRERLGIPANRKVVLYAPTWRDDQYYGPGRYRFTLPMDLRRWKTELGLDFFVLLRTHYLVADQLCVDGLEDFVYDASGHDDITELYLIADVLITDYSSVFFDYANLKRPMIFFTYDLERYRDTLRGFYFDFVNDAPGPIAMTEADVIHELKHLDQLSVTYQERISRFCQQFCPWDDGHATHRVVEKVFFQRGPLSLAPPVDMTSDTKDAVEVRNK